MTKTVIDGIEVFEIPGWEDRYGITRDGRVYSFERAVKRSNDRWYTVPGKWRKTLEEKGRRFIILINDDKSYYFQIKDLLALAFPDASNAPSSQDAPARRDPRLR